MKSGARIVLCHWFIEVNDSAHKLLRLDRGRITRLEPFERAEAAANCTAAARIASCAASN